MEPATNWVSAIPCYDRKRSRQSKTRHHWWLRPCIAFCWRSCIARWKDRPTSTRPGSLFRDGLPHEKITAYLEKWRDRFWLFDEKYPFGQIPTFEPKTWRAWTALAVEHNADNAKVLFDHVDVTEAGSVSHAAAIRWLLATQTFAVSAGKSEISHTGTAPSAGSVFAIPVGSNLFDTMLLLSRPSESVGNASGHSIVGKGARVSSVSDGDYKSVG